MDINYDDLKKRGFLRQKQEGFFVLRTRMPAGVYNKEHIEKLKTISERFGKGFLHATTRQGLEIPFIKYSDIPVVEEQLKGSGVFPGTSGPRLRTTTSCPGNNWCKSGLINTFSLEQKIEEELGLVCGLDLPHKFKIAISGCPNACTRPQQSEIGIHGNIDLSSKDKRVGYTVYLGGCGGKTPRIGFKLDKVFSEEEVLLIIGRVVEFFSQNALPKQRLALLIEQVGREAFIKKILRL